MTTANTRSRIGRLITTYSALALLGASCALAGPLDPPAGAVASTGKTIAETEPRILINSTNTPGDANSTFRIVASGSYYLGGNISGTTGRRGIEIAASNVTIDLNGFTLNGGSGGTTLEGIVTDSIATPRDITIRNGRVVGWGFAGIQMLGTDGSRVIVDVVSANNGSTGINLGNGARLERVSSVGNGGIGITVGERAVIHNSSVTLNNGIGVSAGAALLITGSNISGNASTGISAPSGTVTNCTVSGNSAGIIIAGRGVITATLSQSNGGTGVSAGNNSTLENVTSDGNGTNGISVASGSTVRGCTATGNGAIGFVGSNSVLFETCVARDNVGDGFNAGFGAHVESCVAGLNDGHGFVVSGGSTVRNNTARGNGAFFNGNFAQFRTTSDQSRFEGNTASGNSAHGFWIGGTRNIIIGNTVTGATTSAWNIAGSNLYGPIIDRTAILTATVNGSSAASTHFGTDPRENVTH